MKFLQRIKDGAGKVTDRAQNAVEIGRLNTQISNIERELGLYFQRMGEVFYEGYASKDLSNAEKEMVELAKTCDLLAEERSEIRLKIAELKNERLCGECGKSVNDDALFCQYCGRKLEFPERPAVESDDSQEFEIDKQEPVVLPDALELISKPAVKIMETPPLEAEPEQDEHLLHQLERERRRQEELDRRIRTWKENVEPKQQISTTLETGIPTVRCQVCSAILVKGTKWCPHCDSEQI